MEIILLTVFLSLLWLLLFLVLFLVERRRQRGQDADRASLLPFADEEPQEVKPQDRDSDKA